jgi:hypothetical protein
MSALRLSAGLLLAALVPASARAEVPADPLKVVPAEAELLLRVEKPRALVETVLNYGPFQGLLKLDASREFLDGTGPRRFFQFLAYYERALGAPWPELLDRLAGGGALLAAKYGDKAPALLVVTARDEALLKKFADTVTGLLEQELARQEAKAALERTSHRDVAGIRIGGEFAAAVLGPHLLVSNKPEVIRLAIDTALDGRASVAGRQDVAAAKALVGAEANGWAWFDLAPAHKAPNAKNTLSVPRGDPIQTILFGGWLDVIGRAPFLAAGLTARPGGFGLSFRMPAGRDGMGPDAALHTPPAGQPGSKPLLAPAGTLYTSSFYFDPAAYWNERAKLLSDSQRKELENADKRVPPFLKAVSISTLLQQAGAYHRVVVVHQGELGYTLDPKERPVPTRVPAFAFVTTMRDPQFGKTVDAALRAVALFAGAQAKLKYAEEMTDGVKLVGWKFPEDGTLPNDVNNLRYNFSPCFAVVGDQFFAASTQALGRELVKHLKAEAKTEAKGAPATTRMEFRASGGAAVLASAPDQLLTQTILDRAASPSEARTQVEQFLAWLRTAGVLRVAADYRDTQFRFDIDVKAGE